MVLIEIDGIEIEVPEGSMIIEAADSHGIKIPRFCYHKKLSIAANCRMCLVEVEKAPKPLPACATPVSGGMKIKTQSANALEAQKSVMEFLLINHPLDCPICDQGGECELQDISLNYGKDVSRFTERKRILKDDNLGPLISTDMTRCIHCTRCVRFGEEVTGLRELGATGRGEMTQIGTFVNKNVSSEVSGNVIDLCPVGALTSKPFRFQARAWELSQVPSISAHDCIGSNTYLHVRRNKVMRAVPRENEELNEVWLSDRDRFSYQALSSDDRLSAPMLKKQGNWVTVTWSDALEFVNTALTNIIQEHGSNSIGGLISPNATVEECYLLQKYLRSLGSNNIDHRLRQIDFRNQSQAPSFPNLGMSLAELEEQQAILLVGSDIHKEHPLIGLRLRKMAVYGGKVFVLNPIDFNFNFDIWHKSIVPGGELVLGLANIAKALIIKGNFDVDPTVHKLLNACTPTKEDLLQAENFLQADKSCIMLGQLALMHPEYSQLIALARLISELVSAPLATLSDGANSAGAWLTGCVPHRLPGNKDQEEPALTAQQMLTEPLTAYLLFGIEPEYDSVFASRALETLEKADFVVGCTAYKSDGLSEVADVLLPITPFSEMSGSYINILGGLQSWQPAVSPFAESKPAWKIIRVMAELSGVSDFEYNTTADILAEFNSQVAMDDSLHIVPDKWDEFLPVSIAAANIDKDSGVSLVRIAPIPLYAVDAITRRATALQATLDAILQPDVQMNLTTAKLLKVEHGEMVTVHSGAGNYCGLEVKINPKVPDKSVLIYQAKQQTLSLGLPYGNLKIEKG